LGRADALGGGQVFHGVWEAVHPAEMLATRQLLVANPGLLDKLAAVLQRDDGVDLGIERFDLVERGVHHLDTRDLLGLDRPRQCESIHIDDVGHFRHFRYDYGGSVKAGQRQMFCTRRCRGGFAAKPSIYGVNGVNRNPLTSMAARSEMDSFWGKSADQGAER